MSGSPRIALLATALLAVMLVLSSCGDDGEGAPAGDGGTTAAPAEATTSPEPTGAEDAPEPPGVSDDELVTVAIEALVISADKKLVCNEILTAEALAAAYGDRDGCLSARAPETLAGSARIRKLEIDGDTASAEVVPSGGLYDGETLDVEAVRDGDQWRIDGFSADIPVGP